MAAREIEFIEEATGCACGCGTAQIVTDQPQKVDGECGCGCSEFGCTCGCSG